MAITEWDEYLIHQTADTIDFRRLRYPLKHFELRGFGLPAKDRS